MYKPSEYTIGGSLLLTLLVGGDWNHGMDYDFLYTGNFIIPTDELIFFRGVGIPPTRIYILILV